MYQCKLLEMMACLIGCSCFNKGDLAITMAMAMAMAMAKNWKGHWTMKIYKGKYNDSSSPPFLLLQLQLPKMFGVEQV